MDQREKDNLSILEQFRGVPAAKDDGNREGDPNVYPAVTIEAQAREIERLRAQLSTARRDALEEAAKVAEATEEMVFTGTGSSSPIKMSVFKYSAPFDIAAAIRSLSSPVHAGEAEAIEVALGTWFNSFDHGGGKKEWDELLKIVRPSPPPAKGVTEEGITGTDKQTPVPCAANVLPQEGS